MKTKHHSIRSISKRILFLLEDRVPKSNAIGFSYRSYAGTFALPLTHFKSGGAQTLNAKIFFN